MKDLFHSIQQFMSVIDENSFIMQSDKRCLSKPEYNTDSKFKDTEIKVNPKSGF